jgi:hypothetical protein
MKDVDYFIGASTSECKCIKGTFAENNEISGDIKNHVILMLPASIYSKTTGTATSGAYGCQNFANEQAEVGA